MPTAVADEVVMIHDGRIVFTGTKETLAGTRGLQPRFYELTGTQPTKQVA